MRKKASLKGGGAVKGREQSFAHATVASNSD